MSAQLGDVQHVLVPDRGQHYANGSRVDLTEAPDGTLDLTANPRGKYLVLSCSQTERDGIKMLGVGLYRRY